MRVRHLLAVDAQSVMTRLATRHEEMVKLFSRHRDRRAMLEPVSTLFTSIAFADLAQLPPAEQRDISAFYESLGELRWYLEFTEDMPGQVQLTLGQHLRRLESHYGRLVQIIGLPEAGGAPVVEAQVIRNVSSRRRR